MAGWSGAETLGAVLVWPREAGTAMPLGMTWVQSCGPEGQAPGCRGVSTHMNTKEGYNKFLGWLQVQQKQLTGWAEDKYTGFATGLYDLYEPPPGARGARHLKAMDAYWWT